MIKRRDSIRAWMIPPMTEHNNCDGKLVRVLSAVFLVTQVFSVGVCMYRMLRPDTVYIDNGTGLEGKGGFKTAFWCTIFPTDSG